MKDYENGGHCKRQNLKYNEKHLLLCVNTHGQFILLCWATGGYFSVSGGGEGEEGSHHVQMDLSRMTSPASTGSSGQFLLCEPKTPRRASLCLVYSLLSTWGCRGWLKMFLHLYSALKQRASKGKSAHACCLDALRTGQGCIQYHWLWVGLYSTHLVE